MAMARASQARLKIVSRLRAIEILARPFLLVAISTSLQTRAMRMARPLKCRDKILRAERASRGVGAWPVMWRNEADNKRA